MIVARQGAQDAVSMLVVELERRLIVDGRLQVNLSAAALSQARFRLQQEPGAKPRASRFRENVEGEDAAVFPVRLRDHETDDRVQALVRVAVCCMLGDQSDGIASRDEAGQLHLRVGDAGGETCLIDLPQPVEVGCAIGTKREVHRSV